MLSAPADSSTAGNGTVDQGRQTMSRCGCRMVDINWESPHVYNARVIDVIDGDTVDLEVDLGFDITTRTRFRLLDVDTHETYGVDHDSREYELGKRESKYVKEWLATAELNCKSGHRYPLRIRTYGAGKYGRWLVYIKRQSDGDVLNETLLSRFDGVGG